MCDEPLYAHYLRVTGKPHPGAATVMERHETDAGKVVESLLAPLRLGKSVFYQKHMAHHLLPGLDRGFLARLTSGFLIRDPVAMLASLAKVLPTVELADTGLPQQVELFHQERDRTGRIPVVLDSRELLQDPPAVLAQACAAFGIDYTDAMLSWEPGLRATDGCWAGDWYGNALSSTGFQPYVPREVELPEAVRPLAEPCQRLYDELAAHRLRA